MVNCYTFNSCECMEVNEEALQLHAVYKKTIFLLQVTWESISVLHVMQESVSSTNSHVRCVWTCYEIERLYDKIIITIVLCYTGKKSTLYQTSSLFGVVLLTCFQWVSPYHTDFGACFCFCASDHLYVCVIKLCTTTHALYIIPCIIARLWNLNTNHTRAIYTLY